MFNIIIDKLVKLASCEHEMFKGFKVDPIANAMFCIVAGQVGIGKNDLYECLRLSFNPKFNPSDVNRIKRFSCYNKLKKLLAGSN